jgi:hypothetical protein
MDPKKLILLDRSAYVQPVDIGRDVLSSVIGVGQTGASG